jgi:hypothetical protein
VYIHPDSDTKSGRGYCAGHARDDESSGSRLNVVLNLFEKMKVLGRYRVTAKIDEGCMGEVYRARDRGDSLDLARW